MVTRRITVLEDTPVLISKVKLSLQTRITADQHWNWNYPPLSWESEFVRELTHGINWACFKIIFFQTIGDYLPEGEDTPKTCSFFNIKTTGLDAVDAWEVHRLTISVNEESASKMTNAPVSISLKLCNVFSSSLYMGGEGNLTADTVFASMWNAEYVTCTWSWGRKKKRIAGLHLL